jgi:hypothetical protein
MLGMVFLADVRWAAYAGVLWWGWAFAHSQPRNLALTLSGLVKQSLFAALLAAPLALPLLEYTRLSSRAALSAQDVLALSLPAERLVGLFLPGIRGSHEWVIYPGAVVLILATFALLTVSPGTRRITWFWAGTAALAIFFSLGSQVPFIDNLASLPGIGLLRVPARALFLSGIALVVLAGTGFERYLSGLGSGAERRVKWILVGFNGLIFGLAFAAWRLAGRNPPGFLWGALAFLAASAWFWMGIHPHQNRSRNWLAVLLLIACFDLGGVDLQSLAGRSVESVMAEGEAAATYLRNQPGQFRIYSPSYSIPQHTAAQYDLELVDGVDPLQMASVTRFMEKASGVPQKGYSVTIPPFATGTPEVDNREYRPDPEMLGLLNVAYVVSEFDLPVTGLVLQARIGKTFVYENTFSRPRAWVQPEGERTFLASPPAGELTWTPNVISLTATGPGTLVLSEIAYPGWSVWVDGARQDVQVVDGLLRGVRLDRGEHKVVFQYLPDSLLVGLSLSGSALLFLFLRRLLGRAANPGGREKGKV